MRSPDRMDKILRLIENYWRKHPDQRFFQLISNIQKTLDPEREDFFYYEDEVLIAVMTEIQR